MLKTIDRYVIREVVPPFILALLIFTFVLELPPVMQQLEQLLAKGVPWPTVGRIILLLSPQALGLTIPMALLVGLLIGLGRLSTDRESVALLACGVSPYRLLRPVLALSGVAMAATMYVMIEAIPDANQSYREILFATLSKKVESDIKPRVFFQDFPNWVLYPRNEAAPGEPGWKDVLLANTSKPDAVEAYMAGHGRIVLDSSQADGRADPERRNQLLDDGPGDVERRAVQADHHQAGSRFGVSPGGSRPRPHRKDHRPPAQGHRRQGGPQGIAAQRDHGDSRQVLDPDRMPRLWRDLAGARLARLQGRQARRLRHRDRGDLRLLHRDVPCRVGSQGPPHSRRIRALGAEPDSWPLRPDRSFLARRPRRGAPPVRHPAAADPASQGVHEKGNTRIKGPGCRGRSGSCRSSAARHAPGRARSPLQCSRTEHPRSVHQPHLRARGQRVFPGAARAVLHLDVHRPVRQDLQGRGGEQDRPPAAADDAAIRLLRHSDRGTAQRAGDVRPAGTQQRADRDESLRHQPVSHGAVAGRPVSGIQRHPVRARAAPDGDSQPPGGRARRRDTRPQGQGPEHAAAPLGRRLRTGRSTSTATSTRNGTRCSD